MGKLLERTRKSDVSGLRQYWSSWAFLFEVKNVLEDKTNIKLPEFRELFHQCLLLGGSHMEQPMEAVAQGSKVLGTVKQTLLSCLLCLYQNSEKKNRGCYYHKLEIFQEVKNVFFGCSWHPLTLSYGGISLTWAQRPSLVWVPGLSPFHPFLTGTHTLPFTPPQWGDHLSTCLRWFGLGLVTLQGFLFKC